MQKYQDHLFTKEPIERVRNFGIHPLNRDGFRSYIGNNYHFLHEEGNDPNIASKLMQEVRREMDEERRQATLMEGGGINYVESLNDSKNNVNNNEKNKKRKKGENFIGDYYQVTYISKRTLKNPYLEKKQKKKIKGKSPQNIGLTVGKKSGNKLAQNQNKIHSEMPNISNVNAGRGDLKTYPAPHIN